MPSARSLRDDARAVLARVRPVAGERPHEDRHGQRPQAVQARRRSRAPRRVVRRPPRCRPRSRRRARRAAGGRTTRAARLSRCRSRMLCPAVNRRSFQPPCRPVNSDHSASSMATSGAASGDGTGGIAQHGGALRRRASAPGFRGADEIEVGRVARIVDERARTLDERQRGVQAPRVERRLGGAAAGAGRERRASRRAQRRARRRRPRWPARRVPRTAPRPPRARPARLSSARSATTARCHDGAHGIADRRRRAPRGPRGARCASPRGRPPSARADGER